MNLLDPHQLLMSSFAYGTIDPATIALVNTASGTENSSAGKIVTGSGNLHSNNTNSSGNSSFRISDILETNDDKANTSGENGLLSLGEDERSGSTGSHRSSDCSAQFHSTTACSKKARKARTIFTDKQLQELEATFDKQKYLSVQDRMDLAQRMGLSDTQVKTWYQNRRTKWKRQAAVGMDLLNEASNVAAIQQLLRTNPYWANYMAVNALNQPRFFPLQPTPLTFNLTNNLQSSTSFIPSIIPTTTTSSTVATSTVITGQSLPLAMLPFHAPTSNFKLNFVQNLTIPTISVDRSKITTTTTTATTTDSSKSSTPMSNINFKPPESPK